MNHLRIAISLLIALFAGMASGPDSWAEEANNTEARIARVEAGLLPSLIRTDLASPMWTLAERMQHYQAPAVSLAVLDDFEIVWARAWGVTKLGSDARATPETLFQFGSISKPVAALLTLRMVFEERLGLNDPVNELLTSWKLPDSAAGGTEPVLLRHVLSHGAGIAPFTLHMYEPGEEYPGVLALLKNKAESPIPPVVRVRPPGERFEYANAGYAVMEQLLEDVSGEDLVKLAQKTLFDPLEMKSTSFARKLPVALYEQAAWGHTGEDQAPIDGKGLYPPAAVGGLWSTPTDLGRLLQELMLAYRGDEDRWFPTKLAREMLSPQIQGQGLGVRLRGEARGRYFLHGGGMPGFVALFVAFPETGQGAVVAINGDAYPLLSEVLRAVAAEYDWPGYLPEFEATAMPAERFARFEGRFVFGHHSGGTEMEVSSKGGKFYCWRAEMMPVGERTFAVHELGVVIEFLIDPDGEIRTLRYGEPGINHAWARRMPADLPDRARVDAGVAQGVVRKFVGPFCNLETNLSEDDLKFLGIERGDVCEVRVGGQQLRATVVANLAEARDGEWVMLPTGDSDRLILGRQSANAMAELGVAMGSPVEIKPIRPAEE